jgi:type I restriction enzyme S subunit
MDVKQFLAEFGHIANAPGGVQSLREMVIQLAISGKLVELGAQSSDIDHELAEAEIKRQQYEIEHKIRKTKVAYESNDDVFSVPSHWRWTTLNKLALYIQRGKGPKYAAQSDFRVVSQKCVQWSGFDITPAKFINPDSLEKYGKERFLKNSDLLWNSTGTGTVGRVCIFNLEDGDEKVVADSHVTVIRLANFNARYVWCVVASPWVQQRISPSHPSSLVSGTTQQVELNTSTVKALPIPCPPLDEQDRIVAKVDELMALCDLLETQQQKKRELQNNLRKATLQAVSSAASPFELKERWLRLQDSFGQLFSAPEDVVELRDLVLDLAIKGVLNKTDKDSASVLLEEIATKKSFLIKEGVYKRSQKLEMLQFDIDETFVIPENWVWTKLIDIGEINPRNIADDDSEVTFGPMRAFSGEFGEINNFESAKWGNVRKGFTHFANNDVVLAKITPCFENGKSAVIRGLQGSKSIGAGTTELQVFRPIHAGLLSDFVYIYLRSSLFREEGIKRMTGTAGQKRVSTDYFSGRQFPLPPTSEQREIVSVVNKYIEMCNKLSERLHTANKIAKQFAIASVASLTGITITEEDASLKVPQTELIAPVKLGLNKPDNKDAAPLASLLVRQNGEMNAKDLWQRFGGEVDAFYAQLKTEVAHGWITQPSPANMLEKEESA